MSWEVVGHAGEFETEGLALVEAWRLADQAGEMERAAVRKKPEPVKPKPKPKAVKPLYPSGSRPDLAVSPYAPPKMAVAAVFAPLGSPLEVVVEIRHDLIEQLNAVAATEDRVVDEATIEYESLEEPEYGRVRYMIRGMCEARPVPHTPAWTFDLGPKPRTWSGEDRW